MLPTLGRTAIYAVGTPAGASSPETGLIIMEHWITIVRAVGDVVYLAAAVLTLRAVRAQRDNELPND
jgi:hypothetical protein